MLYSKLQKKKLMRMLHILWEAFKIILEIANFVCSILILFN